MAKVAGAAVGGGIAAGIAQLGPEWSLRFGFAVFIGATVLAILLSPKVDSTAGERDFGGVLLLPGPDREPGHDRSQRRFRSLKPSVRHGLKCVMGARLMTGFLTLFLAFLLRENPISTLDSTLLLGLVIAAAGVGNSLGHRGRQPAEEPLRRSGSGWSCWPSTRRWPSLTAALYSIVHRDRAGVRRRAVRPAGQAVLRRPGAARRAEVVRTSVFARSETVFQICWVFGGTLGIVLPLIPSLGFGLVAGLLGGLLVWTIVADRRAARSAAPAAG